MVLDHIVIDPTDPRNIFAAAWNAQLPNSDGDLYRSHDAGKTWEKCGDDRRKELAENMEHRAELLEMLRKRSEASWLRERAQALMSEARAQSA